MKTSRRLRKQKMSDALRNRGVKLIGQIAREGDSRLLANKRGRQENKILATFMRPAVYGYI